MRLFTHPHAPTGFALTAPLFSTRSIRSGTHTNTPNSNAVIFPAQRNSAANDIAYFRFILDNKVRILRHDSADRSRMVLSGRMADVCAALERMSRAEAISCVR